MFKIVNINCENKNCDDCLMIFKDSDSRQEWTEETYECPNCGDTKCVRIEYDQNGFILGHYIEKR